MNNRLIALLSCAVLVTACGQGQGPETTSDLPIRYAVVNLADINTAASLTARCEEEEATFRAHFGELEEFTGTPTMDGYYKSLDSLYSSLGTVSFTTSSLGSVHPDAELREAVDACSQLLSKVSTDMSLSRPLYDAASKLDVARADEVTRFSVEKLLLSFQLAGVDKALAHARVNIGTHGGSLTFPLYWGIFTNPTLLLLTDQSFTILRY